MGRYESDRMETGVFAEGGAPVPLCGVDVEAEVSGPFARVCVTQRFRNVEARPIEAVYRFPLDEGAAVCGFEAVVDGRHVRGRIEARADAFRTYDRAIADGHGAYLLDEERPDVFTASLGRMAPGTDVLLRITYVTALASEGRTHRFVIPTTVSPRYVPAAGPEAGAGGDLDAPVRWNVPYGLACTVRVAGSGLRIESPSHPIAVAWAEGQATVTLAHDRPALDRDVVLIVEGLGGDGPRVWLERDDDGTAAIAVTFRPDLPEIVVPGEVVFLVDRSGSMQGSSIGEVRSALQFALRSLQAGCRFNIVGFGSTHDALFPASRSYDDSSLREAAAYVDAMQADLGGTEIFPALRFVLDGMDAPEGGRTLVVLTDGQVGNTDEVIELVRARSGRTRLFTFGIGRGASHHLVRGLARAGRGTAEFIFPGERIEPKVLRTLRRALASRTEGARVDWGALAVRQVPSQLPAVYLDETITVFGFVDRLVSTTIRLTVPGGSGGAAGVTLDVPVDPDAVVPGRTIGTLAARERIRELEESQGAPRSGSLQRRGQDEGPSPAPPESVSEVLALSQRYMLVSREASFVAVEERADPSLGQMVLRHVPIALTSGWGGTDGDTGVPPYLAAPQATLSLAIPTFEAGVRGQSARTLGLSGASLVRKLASWFDAAPNGGSDAASLPSSRAVTPRRGTTATRPGARPAAAAHGTTSLQQLVSLQRADGSWALTPAFAAALGTHDGVLARACPGGDHDAWATALATAWLRREAPDAQPLWRMLVRKAEAWLTARRLPSGAASWPAAAERFLEQRRSGLSVGV